VLLEKHVLAQAVHWSTSWVRRIQSNFG